MSETSYNPERPDRLMQISQGLGEAVTAFARAKAERDAAMEIMKDYLLAHTGQQLPLKGYATWLGISHPSTQPIPLGAEVPKPRWTYLPIGSITEPNWEKKKLHPGEYTICEVNDDNSVDLSWPGEENSRRLRAPIHLVRAVSPEEIEAARAPQAS